MGAGQMRYINKLSVNKLKLLLENRIENIRREFSSLVTKEEYEIFLISSFTEAFNYYKYASDFDKSLIDSYSDKVFTWKEIKKLREKFKEIDEELSNDGMLPKKIKLKVKAKNLKPEELAIYKIRYVPLTIEEYLDAINYEIRYYQFSDLDDRYRALASTDYTINDFVRVRAFVLNDDRAKRHIIKTGKYDFEEQKAIWNHGKRNLSQPTKAKSTTTH